LLGANNNILTDILFGRERRSVLVSAEVSKTRKTRRFELTGLLDGVVEWLKPAR
jgi:hypothetical protein